MKRPKAVSKPKKADSLCAQNDCVGCGKNILKWTILANILLVVLALFGGFLSGSVGLMADGAQAVCCLFTSTVISYSIQLSKKRSDEKFPFGYGKLELVVALAVYSILFGLGLFVGISSLFVMFTRQGAGPGLIGLPFALTAVLITYMQYRYNSCAGRNLDSWGITANAENAKADMFTSLAAALGIILSQMGPAFAIFDTLAALVVGIVIIKDSVTLWRSHFKIILDKVPEIDSLGKVSKVVAEVFPGKVELLKPKRVGRKFWIGLGLAMPGTASLQDFEKIQQEIRARLLDQVDWVGEVDFFLNRG